MRSEEDFLMASKQRRGDPERHTSHLHSSKNLTSFLYCRVLRYDRCGHEDWDPALVFGNSSNLSPHTSTQGSLESHEQREDGGDVDRSHPEIAEGYR